MNQKQVLICVLCGLVLPLTLLAVTIHRQQPQTEETIPTDTQPTQAQQIEQREEMLAVLTAQGTVEQMPWEEYLTGVVLSEMPADFHPEALKAQAVVARTYTMKRIKAGSKHEGAAVCMDSSCCQGYRSAEDYLADGGSEESVDKVAQAVADTGGLVLTYEGEMIDATYFSCSGGSTEAAVAVWGTDVPYLQAVDSPGEENATHYEDQVTFTPESFAQKLGCHGSGAPESWFGSVTYTDGGGVDTMEICGQTYHGTELRRLLGLRSTAFTVSVDNGEIIVETRGFGHRVGMSQYGAQAMAESGSGFEEILAYYYQGTTLETTGQ